MVNFYGYSRILQLPLCSILWQAFHVCLCTVHWFRLQMELFSTLLVRQVGNKVHFSWRKHWFIHPSPETRTVDPVHSWGHFIRWFCCVKFANKLSSSDSLYWSRSASYNNLCSRPLGGWRESIKEILEQATFTQLWNSGQIVVKFAILFVIKLDLNLTQWALWLVDSWSRAPDQIPMFPRRDTIVRLLPHAVFVCFFFAIRLFKRKSKYITKHLK